MFIEDELPRLINGDAIVKDGSKYATNFIILRLCDKRVMETKFAPLVSDVADYYAALFKEYETAVTNMGFYGSNFTMKRLGYVALPTVLREKINDTKSGLNMENGAYPPRVDGGYGWFIVDEKETENESLAATESGCNASWDDTNRNCIYYYWIGKYYHSSIYNNGTTWLAPKNLVSKAENGIIPNNLVAEDDLIRLIKANLIIKDGDSYKFNFSIFTREQFNDFKRVFNEGNTKLEKYSLN